MMQQVFEWSRYEQDNEKVSPEVCERAILMMLDHKCPFANPSDWQRRASSPQSEELATAMTMLSPKTINGIYEAEVIHRRGPWRNFEVVEFATLSMGSKGSTNAVFWSP
jgi:hypothetical protein